MLPVLADENFSHRILRGIKLQIRLLSGAAWSALFCRSRLRRLGCPGKLHGLHKVPAYEVGRFSVASEKNKVPSVSFIQ
jgi:hypothetical protein